VSAAFCDGEHPGDGVDREDKVGEFDHQESDKEGRHGALAVDAREEPASIVGRGDPGESLHEPHDAIALAFDPIEPKGEHPHRGEDQHAAHHESQPPGE
jgi:hypothetical protein